MRKRKNSSIGEPQPNAKKHRTRSVTKKEASDDPLTQDDEVEIIAEKEASTTSDRSKKKSSIPSGRKVAEKKKKEIASDPPPFFPENRNQVEIVEPPTKKKRLPPPKSFPVSFAESPLVPPGPFWKTFSDDDRSSDEDEEERHPRGMMMYKFNRGASHSSIYELIKGIGSPNYETQLSSADALGQELLYLTEDKLPGFPVGEVIGALGQALENGANDDLICMCIANLLENIPKAAPVCISQGILDTCIHKLLNPTETLGFVNLLSVIHKISAVKPDSVCRSRGFEACFSCWGWYQEPERSKAINIVSQMCTRIQDADFQYVRPILPNLKNCLEIPQYHESILNCLDTIFRTFATDKNNLDAIFAETKGLHLIVLEILQGHKNRTSKKIDSYALQLLYQMAQGSLTLLKELIVANICVVLKELLETHLPSMELQAVTTCIDALLPSLPSDISFIFPQSQFSTKQANITTFFESNKLLDTISPTLLHPLLEAFSTCAHSSIKSKIASSIIQILHFSTAAQLHMCFQKPERHLSEFIAQLLSERDPSFIAAAIFLLESLVKKFKNIIHEFSREGVVYQLTSSLESLPSLSANQRARTIAIRDWIEENGARIKKKYLHDVKDHKELSMLKEIAAGLQKLQTTPFRESQENAKTLFTKLADIFGSEQPSLFSITQSHVLSQLLNCLSLNDGFEQKRGVLFAQCFEEKGAKTPFLSLITAIDHLLASDQDFSVCVSSPSLASNLRALTNPMKFNFRRGVWRTKLTKLDEKDSNVLDFEDGSVLIDPLTKVSNIEQFLAPKVMRSAQEEVDDGRRKTRSSKRPTKSPKTKKGSAAQATNQKLILSIGSFQLDPTQTALQGVFDYASDSKRSQTQLNSSGGIDFWNQEFTIYYRLGEASPQHTKEQTKNSWLGLTGPSPIASALQSKPKFSFKPQTSDHVMLLWLLYQFNNSFHQLKVPIHHFFCEKLDTKFGRQLSDSLSVCGRAFPKWCGELVVPLNFLFSLQTRISYLKASFGVERAILLLDKIPTNTSKLPTLRLRISRNQVFESAFRVFNSCGKSNALLDIQYFDEIGFGLGPTKEFYSLLSKQIQKRSLGLFLDCGNEEIDAEYLFNPHGLFPKPIINPKTKDTQRILKCFYMIGQFVAKALFDDRLIDVPFCVPFFKLILGQSLTFKDLSFILPNEASFIIELQDICQQKLQIQQDPSLTKSQKETAIQNIKYRNAPIEQMDLNFTIKDIELKPGGIDEVLTIHNLEEFLELIGQTFLGKGIELQIATFKEGFNQFFPITKLSIFSPEELEQVLCGSGIHEEWSNEALLASIEFPSGSGYSRDSVQIQWLVGALAAFDNHQRRMFLSFLTGSPRLPVGGLKGLKNKFQIMRVLLAKDGSLILPSANTCRTTLKLPEYPSRDVLLEKILTAIEQGPNSFDLS